MTEFIHKGFIVVGTENTTKTKILKFHLKNESIKRN